MFGVIGSRCSGLVWGLGFSVSGLGFAFANLHLGRDHSYFESHHGVEFRVFERFQRPL